MIYLGVFIIPALGGSVAKGRKPVLKQSSYLHHYTFMYGSAYLSQAKTEA